MNMRGNKFCFRLMMLGLCLSVVFGSVLTEHCFMDNKNEVERCYTDEPIQESCPLSLKEPGPRNSKVFDELWKDKSTILITGLDGFIGHTLLKYFIQNTNMNIVGLSRIDPTSTLHRILDIIDSMDPVLNARGRVKFVYHDLRSPINEFLSHKIGPNVKYILHLAASTHVDRSIENPMEFILDNVVGTCNILEYAKTIFIEQKQPGFFLYFSTDEVFGPAPEGIAYKEWDRYKSSNPYAATKAGAEELVLSYHNTYGLPTIITHTMNVFGPRQHPEKFIPLIISKVLQGQTVTIHSNKEKTKAGSRYYMHSDNVAAALGFLIQQFENGNQEIIGDKFNIVGDQEVDNLHLATIISKILSKPLKYEMVDFHSSRPGHDLRYALDGTKLLGMGFKYPSTFEEKLQETIEWYLSNREWLTFAQNETK